MEKLIKADRLDEIFRRVGAALWMLQNLETQAAMFYLLRIRVERGIGFEQGTEMLIKQQRKTFGNTLRSIEKSNVLPQELQRRFHEILAERNWLAHGSSIQGYSAIESDESTSDLIGRIENIKIEALVLIKALRELAINHAEKAGITSDEIQAGMEVAKNIWFGKGII